MDRGSVLTPQIQEILNTIAGDDQCSVAYDTAWIAQLGDLLPHHATRALEWLRINQLPDGSWGAPHFEYGHDRLVCTLAAMLALTRYGSNGDHKRVKQAAGTLNKWVGMLGEDSAGATAGFELLIPTLIEDGGKLGILPNGLENVLAEMAAHRVLKLVSLPDNMINRYVTVAFSAEMVGLDAQILLDVPNLQEANGSVGASPAATAFFAKHVCPGDPRALQFLESAVHNDGGVPSASPIDIFEIGWILWNLSFVHPPEELAPHVQPLLDILEKAWVPGQGLGWHQVSTLFDSDDTSIAMEVLYRYGREIDLPTLLTYETDTHFRCYKIESGPSVSSNIHVIGALRQVGFTKDHPTIQKLLAFLKKHRTAGTYWYDKWHTSALYTTSHAVISLQGLDNNLADRAANWILFCQNADGSWGGGAPTAEETAHALQALIYARRHGADIPLEPIRLAANWLKERTEPPYPNLWIGKTLYSPVRIVKAVILTALVLAEQELGSL